MEGCIGCNQAITQQKAQDAQTIAKAKEIARDRKTSIGLYGDEQAIICIANGPNYHIIHIITPDMQ